jgi:hypothetical protein
MCAALACTLIAWLPTLPAGSEDLLCLKNSSTMLMANTASEHSANTPPKGASSRPPSMMMLDCAQN